MRSCDNRAMNTELFTCKSFIVLLQLSFLLINVCENDKLNACFQPHVVFYSSAPSSNVY